MKVVLDEVSIDRIIRIIEELGAECLKHNKIYHHQTDGILLERAGNAIDYLRWKKEEENAGR